MSGTETALKDALDQLVDGATIDVDRIESAARSHGRRLRLRRRTVGALGAAASVTALALASPVVLPDRGTVAAPATNADGSETVQLGQPVPDGWWNELTAREMYRRLELPEGAVVTDVERLNNDVAPDEEAGQPYRGRLALHVDTGGGPGSFELMFYGPRTEPVERTEEPGLYWALRCRPAWDACQLQRDAAGQVTAKLLTQVYDGVTINTVYARGADGVIIYAASANSVQEKWTSPTSAPEPPLDLQQLLQIARSDAWGE